jgi:hypothetical protein
MENEIEPEETAYVTVAVVVPDAATVTLCVAGEPV